MLKHILKKTLLFFIVAIIALTHVVSDVIPISAGTKANLKKVKKYIGKQEKSQISGWYEGYYYGVVYDEDFDALSFVFFKYTDAKMEDCDIMMRLDMPSNMKGEGDISMVYKEDGSEWYAKGKINPRKCKASEDITYKITDNNGNDCSEDGFYQEGFHHLFDAGMALCDECLYDETGYHLKALGIKKFKLKNIDMFIRVAPPASGQ